MTNLNNMDLDEILEFLEENNIEPIDHSFENNVILLDIADKNKFLKIVSEYDDDVIIFIENYLCSDGHFSGSLVSYYRGENSYLYASSVDYTGFVDDCVTCGLLKELGWRHPVRVLNALKSIKNKLDCSIYTIFENDENIDDYIVTTDYFQHFESVYKAIKEIAYKKMRYSEAYLIIAEDLSTNNTDKTLILKTVNYHQSSPDYTAKKVKKDNLKEIIEEYAFDLDDRTLNELKKILKD